MATRKIILDPVDPPDQICLREIIGDKIYLLRREHDIVLIHRTTPKYFSFVSINNCNSLSGTFINIKNAIKHILRNFPPEEICECDTPEDMARQILEWRENSKKHEETK